MSTRTELKDRIENYLEYADQRILKIINAIIQADIEERGLSQSQKDILD